tara:strand:- start:118 stop:573 length:456 start_codon:yes stop_codon:yes gene_type:complete
MAITEKAQALNKAHHKANKDRELGFLDTLANMPVGGGSSGGTFNPSTRLTLNQPIVKEKLTRITQGQVKRITKILARLGGTALIQEMMEYGLTQEALDNGCSWRVGDIKQAPNTDYVQEIWEVMPTYKELCNLPVSKEVTKAGVCEFFKIT